MTNPSWLHSFYYWPLETLEAAALDLFFFVLKILLVGIAVSGAILGVCVLLLLANIAIYIMVHVSKLLF